MLPVTAAPLDRAQTRAVALVQARAWVREGRIRVAEALLLELARDPVAGVGPAHATTLGLLVDCHLARGSLAAAVTLGERLSLLEEPEAHHARAEVAAAVGESELALQQFAAVAEADVDDLALPWRAGSALAMLRLGRCAPALDLAHTHHAAALARGTAYDLALSWRVLATTDPGLRLAALHEALDVLDDVPAARLRAQVQTDLAGLLLLSGRVDDALPLLRSAEAYAAVEDLWPLQSRVRRLLERTGEQPRQLESEAFVVLTRAERRVALLVLGGLTNREVAEHLAVSVKAVEGHLSKVYRKLGLGSRRALFASFAPPH